MFKRPVFVLTAGAALAVAALALPGAALRPADAAAGAAANRAAAVPPIPPGMAEALFAGGCFWSTETDLQKVPGVVRTTAGFAGGRVKNPSYADVSTGRSGHREAVRVIYDPRRITYAQLVDRFLHTIDPADAGGTFCDRGDEYRTAIFALTLAQQTDAQQALKRLERLPRFKGHIATQVLPGAPFYAAEDYHQDYHRKNPLRYASYREGCGRDAALRAIWGKAPGE
ncbi:MAG: peptide-methionine (S)-S-oxide reductase MsrA [Sphingomonadaceae bacterium]|nr:peptide-methionine (S)-S-oxide reductase MsrA [Sphingomonadaceae bacterium]